MTFGATYDGYLIGPCGEVLGWEISKDMSSKNSNAFYFDPRSDANHFVYLIMKSKVDLSLHFIRHVQFE